MTKRLPLTIFREVSNGQQRKTIHLKRFLAVRAVFLVLHNFAKACGSQVQKPPEHQVGDGFLFFVIALIDAVYYGSSRMILHFSIVAGKRNVYRSENAVR